MGVVNVSHQILQNQHIHGWQIQSLNHARFIFVWCQLCDAVTYHPPRRQTYRSSQKLSSDKFRIYLVRCTMYTTMQRYLSVQIGSTVAPNKSFTIQRRTTTIPTRLNMH